MKLNYGEYIDRDVFASFEHFLHKVNEKWEKQYGLRDSYDSGGDPALAEDVEYFGQWILADDRMRYIIENIVAIPDEKLSQPNKIGNTIISHFYGARGIHQIITGIDDPQRAHVDFERISFDQEYLSHLKENCFNAKKSGKKFYGTTELHTSLQTAGRNYCREKYNDPARLAVNTDIIEWISSWTTNGVIDKILNVPSLEGMYKVLTSQRGIGEYYGYHCATSNSVNHALPFHHDEEFCAPGPGARASLDLVFAPLKASGKVRRLPYGELVIYIREHQSTLFKTPVVSHPFFHNFIANCGTKIFDQDQHELTVYTTEVALCQFGVYCYFKDNPHLISRRKVARLEDDSVCDLAHGVEHFEKKLKAQKPAKDPKDLLIW